VPVSDLLAEEVGLTALFVLAFANGANDVGKSVASLMSSTGPGGPDWADDLYSGEESSAV